MPNGAVSPKGRTVKPSKTCHQARPGGKLPGTVSTVVVVKNRTAAMRNQGAHAAPMMAARENRGDGSAREWGLAT